MLLPDVVAPHPPNGTRLPFPAVCSGRCLASPLHLWHIFVWVSLMCFVWDLSSCEGLSKNTYLSKDLPEMDMKYMESKGTN